jgi:GSH-dependent disulfide-bond oxidoreductase
MTALQPVELYTWATPNGRKASIMLEEVGLPYVVKAVDLRTREHMTPAFQAISPWQRIPAIVDPHGTDGVPFTVFESTAILLYLAEKTGKLLPAAGAPRYEALKWLMLQTAGIGPFCGQAQVFGRFLPQRNEGAIAHFEALARGLMDVLERQLTKNAFVAGDDYTIADVATWPWIARADWFGVSLDHHPSLTDWYQRVGARPAVARGYAVPGDDSMALPARCPADQLR